MCIRDSIAGVSNDTEILFLNLYCCKPYKNGLEFKYDTIEIMMGSVIAIGCSNYNVIFKAHKSKKDFE